MELNCIIKKSAARDYGVFSITEIDGTAVHWDRAMTVKEAVKKKDNYNKVDAFIFEDPKDKDGELISELLSTGYNVILLNGELVDRRAALASSLNDVETLLRKVANSESLVWTGSNSAQEEQKSEEVASDSGLNDFDAGFSTSESTGVQSLQSAGVEYEKYEEAIQERNRWKSIAENAQFELREIQRKIDEITADEDVIEYISSGEEGKANKLELERAKNEIERLTKVVTSLQSERSGRRDVEAKLDDAENEIARLKIALVDAKENTEIMRSTLMKSSYYGCDLMNQVGTLKDNIMHLTKLKQAVDDALLARKKDLETAEGKISELENENKRVMAEIEDTRESNEELSRDIINLEEDKKKLKLDLDEARDKINDLSDREQNALDEVEKRERELAEIRGMDVDKMQNTIEQDTYTINEYEKALNDVNTENDALKQTIMSLEEKVRNYKDMADSAKNKYIASERRYNGDNGVVNKIDYTGRGILLAVVGSGGYGTTSVATSMAEMLANNNFNVALVDMDFRSPKMESVYGIVPFNDCLNQVIKEPDRRTSLGAFIRLGAVKWTNFMPQLGVTLHEGNKSGGKLVYYPGSYATLSATEIGGSDYGAMLKRLGIEYEYIVIDLGRLEGFGSVANVQNGICNAAAQIFAVTNSTLTDVRSFSMRGAAGKFKFSNTCWVLNMAEKHFGRDIEAIVSDAESHVEVPIQRDLYGTNFSLNENKKTRRAVEEMIAYIRN